jgi:hypothetical protein
MFRFAEDLDLRIAAGLFQLMSVVPSGGDGPEEELGV